MMMMIGRQTIHHQVPNGGELAVGVIQVPMWHQLLSKKKNCPTGQQTPMSKGVRCRERERKGAERESKSGSPMTLIRCEKKNNDV
jgi:ligand-binding sensor protein